MSATQEISTIIYLVSSTTVTTLPPSPSPSFDSPSSISIATTSPAAEASISPPIPTTSSPTFLQSETTADVIINTISISSSPSSTTSEPTATTTTPPVAQLLQQPPVSNSESQDAEESESESDFEEEESDDHKDELGSQFRSVFPSESSDSPYGEANDDVVSDVEDLPLVIRGKIGQAVPEEIGAKSPALAIQKVLKYALAESEAERFAQNSPTQDEAFLSPRCESTEANSPPSSPAQETTTTITTTITTTTTVTTPRSPTRSDHEETRSPAQQASDASASVSTTSTPSSVMAQPKLSETRSPGPSSSPSSPSSSQQLITLAMEEVAPEKTIRVLYDFNGRNEAQLSIKKGELLSLLKKGVEGQGHGKGWWLGELNGKIGYFPAAYVEEILDAIPSSQETTPATSPTTALSPRSTKARKEKKQKKRHSTSEKEKNKSSKKHSHKSKNGELKRQKSKSKSADTSMASSASSSRSGSHVQPTTLTTAESPTTVAIDSDMKSLTAVAARPENTAAIEEVKSRHDIFTLMSSLETSSTPLESEDGLVKSLRNAVADLSFTENRVKRSSSDTQHVLTLMLEKESTFNSVLPPVKGRRASVAVDSSDRTTLTNPHVAPSVPSVPVTGLGMSPGSLSRTTPTVIVYRKDASPRPFAEERKDAIEKKSEKEDKKNISIEKVSSFDKSKNSVVIVESNGNGTMTSPKTSSAEEKPPLSVSIEIPSTVSSSTKKRSLKRKDRRVRGTLSSSAELVNDLLSTFDKEDRKVIPLEEVKEVLSKIKKSLSVPTRESNKTNIVSSSAFTTPTSPRGEEDVAKEIAKLEAKISKAKKKMKKLKEVASSSSASIPSTPNPLMATQSTIIKTKPKTQSRKHLKKYQSTGSVLKESKDSIVTNGT